MGLTIGERKYTMKKRRKINKRKKMENGAKILSNIAQKPYFIKDNFVLYHANCLDILSQLPDNSIDMIFADPPYNLSNGGFSVHAGRMVSVNKGDWDKSKGFKDDYEFHYKWLEACKRVLKPEGSLWVSGTYHLIYQV